MEGIRRQLKACLEQIVAKVKPEAVGVGFGGPVNWRTGSISRSHQIEGWSEFDLCGWLREIVHAPVYADNDANVAALAEAYHGAGDGANPVFYVTLGSGVGGGLVVDGRIYHGATPGESEIGHVLLDRTGTILESRCSGWAVDARIRALKKTRPGSLLCKLAAGNKGGEAMHLPAALEKDDEAAKEILRETAEDLAFGLSHVVQLFSSGDDRHWRCGLSNVGEPLRQAVANALQPLIMKVFLPGPCVCLTKLAEDAVPVCNGGALVLPGGH